jgi:hypothetical protein
VSLSFSACLILLLATPVYVPILLCIILLPIVPSYLLFAALPAAKGSVDGTLAGLKIKLSGAFAGYFAVVALVFSTHNIWNPLPPPPVPPPLSYQVWELSGTVTDENGTPVDPLDIRDFALVPPTFQTTPGGNFTLTFATMPAPGGGIKYPTVVINHPTFQATPPIPMDPSASTELDPSLGLRRDNDRREITVRCISLKKLPVYKPQVGVLKKKFDHLPPPSYATTGTASVITPAGQEPH